jgi:hypothetical protein
VNETRFEGVATCSRRAQKGGSFLSLVHRAERKFRTTVGRACKQQHNTHLKQRLILEPNECGVNEGVATKNVQESKAAARTKGMNGAKRGRRYKGWSASASARRGFGSRGAKTVGFRSLAVVPGATSPSLASGEDVSNQRLIETNAAGVCSCWVRLRSSAADQAKRGVSRCVDGFDFIRGASRGTRCVQRA